MDVVTLYFEDTSDTIIRLKTAVMATTATIMNVILVPPNIPKM